MTGLEMGIDERDHGRSLVLERGNEVKGGEEGGRRGGREEKRERGGREEREGREFT